MNRVMNFLRVVLGLACLALSVGCSERQKAQSKEKITSEAILRHVITWSDGVTIYTVVYVWDGEKIGRGKQAYEELMRRIEKLPDGSNLEIRFPADIAALLAEAIGREDELPFRGYDLERDAFNKLCAERHIGCLVGSFAPVEFVEKNK